LLFSGVAAEVGVFEWRAAYKNGGSFNPKKVLKVNALEVRRRILLIGICFLAAKPPRWGFFDSDGRVTVSAVGV